MGARTTARSRASGHESAPSRTSPTPNPTSSVSGSAEPEQARRDRHLFPQCAEVDSRCVAEENEGERRLGEELDGLALDCGVDEPERVGADEQPDDGEHHRRRDRRPLEPTGDGGESQERERDRGQCPGHVREPSARPGAQGRERRRRDSNPRWRSSPP